MRTTKSLAVALTLFAILAFVIASSLLVSSQEVTAAIVGTVTDPSGAPIKGASVTATRYRPRHAVGRATNEAGAYDLLLLPIGNYALKLSAAGFETAVHPAFALVLNQTARVDVQMKARQRSPRRSKSAPPPRCCKPKARTSALTLTTSSPRTSRCSPETTASFRC